MSSKSISVERPTFKTLLIANRGEIACRIIRTAKRMGIKTVAVYSEADKHALHVRLADSAYPIGPAKAEESYLNIDRILDAANLSQADAIHPGYGFLSENALFAERCHAADIIFIGPSIKALDIMGSKQKAKQLLEPTTVPLIPGYQAADQSDQALLEATKAIGFPVLIKAAAGGGGKGMRTVNQASDFSKALQAAQREAKAYFGDDTVILEKLITPARHIEVQIMADQQGHVVHLFDRECSLQRRHQKIIEEAPATHLSAETKMRLYDAAITVAKSIDYLGAGTIEFLVDAKEQFYFMEMNTRLQVEHPVTEAITGLDLVEWQIRISRGEGLPLSQSQIKATGHAIECRVYAEDPNADFLPSMGQLNVIEIPSGDGIRLDTGFESGDQLTPYYDPLIAKLITYCVHREEALSRMQQALKHYALCGVTTNLSFLQAICAEKDFIKGPIDTDFLESHPNLLQDPDPLPYLYQALLHDYLKTLPTEDPIAQTSLGWHPFLTRTWCTSYALQGRQFIAKISTKHAQLILQVDDHTPLKLTLPATLQPVIEQGEQLICFQEGRPQVLTRPSMSNAAEQAAGHHKAPMPGTVVSVLKQEGDLVKIHEAILIIEAMKMEHTIHATQDGILRELFYQKGDLVPEGAELFRLEHQMS